MSTTSPLKQLTKFIFPDSIVFCLAPYAVGQYAKWVTWYRYGRHHAAPIDPMKLIWVDPGAIKYKMASKEQYFSESDAISEVVGGDWDKHVQRLEEYDLYRSIVHRVRDEVPWEETDFYDRVQQRYETRDYDKWGCSTFAEFRERLDEIDELHETIASEGYKTQRELRSATGSVPASRKIHYYWPPELHEVTINIGRDGDLIFHEGRHRFAIASALELDQVPVRIKARHSKWQMVRDKTVSDKRSDGCRSGHPDL